MLTITLNLILPSPLSVRGLHNQETWSCLSKISSDVLKELTERFEARAYPSWYLDETTESAQCNQLPNWVG